MVQSFENIYIIYLDSNLHGFTSQLCINDPKAPDRKGHVRERSKVFLGGGKIAARPRPAPEVLSQICAMDPFSLGSLPMTFNGILTRMPMLGIK